jgi:hypothetical protein
MLVCNDLALVHIQSKGFIKLSSDVFRVLCSFATAAAMLSGLLLYDVFWVFGSSHVFGDNVMVTVSH